MIKHSCANCEGSYYEFELNDIKRYWERVDESDKARPSGECPSCGALCYATQPQKPKLTPKQKIEACAAGLDLTMTHEFVPFSKSCVAKEDRPSLNYIITLSRPGAFRGANYDVRFDYSMGSGHCKSRLHPGPRDTLDNLKILRTECELGYPTPPNTARRAMPELADVLSSIAMDSNVLEYPTFETWAEDVGPDTDSRKAEKIYRECLDTALRMRALIGDAGLEKLREACQDY